MVLTNIVVETYALAVTVVLLMCNLFDRRDSDRQAVLMKKMLWCNMALLGCTIATLILEGRPRLEALDYVLTCGECALGFPLAIIYTEYAVHLIAEKASVPRYFTGVICTLGIIAIALNVVSIFNHMFFSCEGSVYARGPLFWCNQAFSGAILIPDVILVFSRAKTLGRTRALTLVLYVVLPLLATVIQFPIPEFNTMCIATTLAILILYITVYIHRSRMLAEQEKELTESRISVMLSQIQPHFLYNALSVIQDMCHGKAPEAEKATIEFSEFLRSNLDSLKVNVPISFEQELKHTKNYLALEKKRFGDRLNVEYDIKTTMFRLPALTLQPIVENAVRYGVLQREESGTVMISTCETDDSFLVSVIDDGVGFDVMTPKNDGRTHIGIANVRERLKTMSGGRLVIESTPGRGTRAFIVVPKGGQS